MAVLRGARAGARTVAIALRRLVARWCEACIRASQVMIEADPTGGRLL